MSDKFLQYVSDIHLERLRNIPIIKPISPGNSYLALCGDIGRPYIRSYKEFLSVHSKMFNHIFIVSGNHEYHSQKQQRTISFIDKKIERICKAFDNVTYLNKSFFEIGDTIFVGCTLWSDVSKIISLAETKGDYRSIYLDTTPEDIYVKTEQIFGKSKYTRPNRRLIKATDIISLHQDHKKFLLDTIEKHGYKDKNIIILTHHAPSLAMLGKYDIYSPCYASDCDDMIQPPVKYWISGHTHQCLQKEINNVSCLSNCMGYPGQNPTGFDKDSFVIFT